MVGVGKGDDSLSFTLKDFQEDVGLTAVSGSNTDYCRDIVVMDGSIEAFEPGAAGTGKAVLFSLKDEPLGVAVGNKEVIEVERPLTGSKDSFNGDGGGDTDGVFVGNNHGLSDEQWYGCVRSSRWMHTLPMRSAPSGR